MRIKRLSLGNKRERVPQIFFLNFSPKKNRLFLKKPATLIFSLVLKIRVLLFSDMESGHVFSLANDKHGESFLASVSTFVPVEKSV